MILNVNIDTHVDLCAALMLSTVDRIMTLWLYRRTSWSNHAAFLNKTLF